MFEFVAGVVLLILGLVSIILGDDKGGAKLNSAGIKKLTKDK